MLERVTLERRAGAGLGLRAASYAASIAVATALSLAVLVWQGVPTAALWSELVVQVFFAPAGLAQTVTMAIPMTLIGLAAALCLRLRFWNIGLSGQMLAGAMLATAVALHDIGGAARLPVMLMASALGGALWIALPLLLRIRLGVSEVIVTLMLSNIAYLLLQHMLFGPFRDPTHNFPSSSVFDTVERLPQLGFGSVHMGLFVALAVVALLAVLTHRTRFGFAARITGDNPGAARAMGFDTVRVMAISILLGGAMAGLAGGVVVAGTEFRLSMQVGLNATFNGIVIAALARNEPLAVPVVAMLIAGLNVASASLKVFYGVSEGVVLIVQGIILLTLVTGQFFASYRVSFGPRNTPRPAAHSPQPEAAE